jgi:hypothetical protein
VVAYLVRLRSKYAPAYEELAERLKKHGFKETRPASPTSSRVAPFRRTFFLAALVVIGCEAVTPKEI